MAIATTTTTAGTGDSGAFVRRYGIFTPGVRLFSRVGLRLKALFVSLVLVLPPLNEMFDITTTRTFAARLHPPGVVFALLVALALGGRAALIVGVAVPVTLALTLLVYYLLGYTLNRVTLFALIFSIGILVDDAIVVVENIHRHFTKRGGGSRSKLAAILAVDEVDRLAAHQVGVLHRRQRVVLHAAFVQQNGADEEIALVNTARIRRKGWAGRRTTD